MTEQSPNSELLQSTVDQYPRLGESIDRLREVGHDYWNRGWSRGTSSNYSIVIDRNPMRLLVTASGKDKGHLGRNDFVIVDEEGNLSPKDQAKSSAETLLHCSAVLHQNAGAVLHTHSVWATILSQHYSALNGIWIEGFEMLKGLEGISTHESRVWLPIFDNTQDIPALREQVEAFWSENPSTRCWGYLIRQHGMYCWGSDLSQAIRHMEVLEFLLECIGRKMSVL